MAPSIPLYLAEISATVLLTLRGAEIRQVRFYSWVWASGKHGGPRLFKPFAGSVHVLYLTKDSGYLHTVGDYPAYDLEVPTRSVPGFLANWQAGYQQGSGLIERIVAVELKSELEAIPVEQDPRGLNIAELQILTSPSFIASQLDLLCHGLRSPAGRSTACVLFADGLSNQAK